MFCSKCGLEIADAMTACGKCSQPVGMAGSVVSPAASIVDKAKVIAADAWMALRRFALDPVGGLQPAYEMQGGGRSLRTGIALCVAGVVLVFLGAYLMLPPFMRPGLETGDEFLAILKMMFCATVPFASLWGLNAALRKAFAAKSDFGADSFIAGASLLPVGVTAFIAGVVGFGNTEIIIMVNVLCVCLIVLMLFAGYSRIYKMGDRVSTFAVPVVLLLAGWLTKIILAAILPRMF